MIPILKLLFKFASVRTIIIVIKTLLTIRYFLERKKSSEKKQVNK